MAIEIKRKNLTSENQKILSNILKVEIKNNFVRKQGNHRDFSGSTTEFLLHHYDTENKIFRIPMYIGIRFCEKEQISKIKIERPDVKKYKMVGKARDYQESIIDKTYDLIKKYKTSLIAAYPSAGKTFMGVYLGSMLGPAKIGIIISSKTLAGQWINTFYKITNAKVHYYKCPKREYPEDIPWEYNVPLEKANVVILMVLRIETLSLEDRRSFGIVIVDEAHKFCTEKMGKLLLSLSPKYLLLLTATPDKKNGSDKVLKLMAGTHRVVEKLDKYFKVYSIKTGIVPTIEENKAGMPDFTILCQSLLYNPIRNKYIRHLVLKNLSFKILILTKEQQHVEDIQFLLDECKLKYSSMYGNKKSYKDRRILIGTVSKIGTGFDEANFATKFKGEKLDLLIMTISYKDRNAYEQTLGRILRSDDPRIIFLSDNSHINQRHTNELRLWTKSQLKGDFESIDLPIEPMEKKMDKFCKKYIDNPIKPIKIKRKEPVFF